jgi:DNA-binding NtrC family response regulator
MSNDKKMDLVFIKDDTSRFDAGSEMFKVLFDKVEVVSDTNKALKFISKNPYHIVINDVSVHPIDGITFVKQIKQLKPELIVAALVAPEDEDKIGGLIETGVHSFVLIPEQLDQALEVIAQMKPDKKREA